MTERVYLATSPLAAVLHLVLAEEYGHCFHGEHVSGELVGQPKIMCEVIAARLEAYFAAEEDEDWEPHLYFDDHPLPPLPDGGL